MSSNKQLLKLRLLQEYQNHSGAQKKSSSITSYLDNKQQPDRSIEDVIDFVLETIDSEDEDQLV